MILLVEDEEIRRNWFKSHCGDTPLDITGDVDQAILMLSLHDYDTLWLDHDLGTEPKVGRDVAKWLIANPDRLPHMAIYVHSVNVVSGPKMVLELKEAGRPAQYVPFTQLLSMGYLP